MRIRFVGLAALGLTVVLGTAMSSAQAQGKSEKGQKAQEKLTNVQGTVQAIDSKTSAITVAVDGSAPRVVVYNTSTKFLAGHSTDGKAAAATQIKKGNFIACSGTFDNKAQLMAKDCVFRDTK